MTNLEWLGKAKKAESKFIEGEDFEYRKTKALEIIAEELCLLHKYLTTPRWCDIPKGKIIERRQNPSD